MVGKFKKPSCVDLRPYVCKFRFLTEAVRKVGEAMKVVFLRSNPVEPEPRVEKEVNSLIKNEFEVEIVAWDRNSKYKIRESYLNLEAGKVKIYRFGIPASYGGGIKKNLIPLILFQIKLYKWLYSNRNEYDVIHACDFDTAYIAMKVAKKCKKKFVYDIFDYYVDTYNVPNLLKPLIKRMDHTVINSADATIICTDKRKEQIKGATPKRLVVIHNTPAQLDMQIEKFKLDESKIKIVYVGVLGYGRFLKEIAQFVKDNPNYEFHVGGFGELENYFKEMSREYSNIIFYGKLPYEKTLKLENSCDIMTAIYDPSISNHYYAAPNKFYEALMLGKPLIVAKNTGIDEIVLKNNLGEVIEYNLKSFQIAINRLVQRKEEWPKISQKMKELYKKEYSWAEMEKRLVNLYKEILK